MEKARLAAAMTQITEQNEDSIRRAWCALGLPAGGKLWFSTILVHLTNVSDCSEIPGLTDFMSWLQKAAQKKKIAFLYSSRTESRLLLHLYRSAELTRKYVAWFTLQLQKFLMNRFQFFIAAGMPVRGLLQVGLSYPVNRTDWKVVSILPPCRCAGGIQSGCLAVPGHLCRGLSAGPHHLRPNRVGGQ